MSKDKNEVLDLVDFPRVMHGPHFTTKTVDRAGYDDAVKAGFTLKPQPETLVNDIGAEHVVSTVDEKAHALKQGWKEKR